jgi:hypothetical protein
MNKRIVRFTIQPYHTTLYCITEQVHICYALKLNYTTYFAMPKTNKFISPPKMDEGQSPCMLVRIIYDITK